VPQRIMDAATHMNCLRMDTGRHSIFVGRAESRSPFKGSGSPGQFLPLPATALVCLTFGVCRMDSTTVPLLARPVCNVDGPEHLRLPGYEARGFLLIPMPTVGLKQHKPS